MVYIAGTILRVTPSQHRVKMGLRLTYLNKWLHGDQEVLQRPHES